MSTLKEKISALSSSREPEERRACIPLLAKHLAENPADVEAWYQKACCHDFLGEELAAEPCYLQVYNLGWQSLPAEEHSGFFVGFGSTLRNNGKLEESISRLEEGVKLFPGRAELKIFLALSLYSAKRDLDAAEALFPACLQAAASGFGGYERAIQYYVDNLRASRS